MATTYGLAAEFQALLNTEIPTGASDKAFLYASGSGADAALYAKLGDNTQVALMTSGFSLQDTANGGIADFTYDGTANVTVKVDPTNATAITAVADGDLVLVADADDSNNLKKITRAHFIESAALDAINIDGGAIDGTPIGANAQSTAKFTTLSASGDFNVVSNAFVEGTLNVTGAATFASSVTAVSLSASSDLNVVGNAFVEGTMNVTGALTAQGTATLNGDVDLGNATSDTITATGRFDSDLVPSSDGARDLGTSTLEWKDLYIDGVAYIDDLRADALGAALDCASQAMTNINVDSGAIDGATLGGNAQVTITDADMNGGSIDGVVIGAASAAAGTFTAIKGTTISGSGDLNVVGSAFVETNMNITGTLVVNGNVDLGNATSDTITATGRFDSDLVPSTDGARDLGGASNEWKDLYIDGVAYIDDLRADALGAALDCASQAMTNINVDSGAIDGVTIGTNSAATRGVFTHLTASHMKIDNNLIVVGDLQVQGNIDSITVTQNTLEVEDKLIIAGASGSSAAVSGGGLMIGGSDLADDEVAAVLWDHANSALDFNIGTTTEIRLQDGVLRPETDNDVDLGASGAEFKDLYLDGVAYIDTLNADALGANLDHANFNSTNVDIDSGAIDGTVIGANSAAAGTFAALVATSMSASADLNVVGSAYVEGSLNVTGALNLAGALAASALSSSGDLNVVGSTFIETNLNVTGNALVQGSLTANGTVQLGNASSDVVTVTSQLTASEGVALGAGQNVDMSAGAVDFLLIDNNAAALEIKQGSNLYMAFRSTDSQEAIVVGSNNVTTFMPSVDSGVALGASSLAWSNLYVDAIDLQGQGSISMGGTGRIDLDADDDTSIRASADDVITFEVAGADEFQMSANMFGPASADGASLGGASNEWSDLYLADAGVIYFGSDQDILLTHDADQGLTIEQGTDAAGDPILTLKTVGDLASGAELKFALDNGAGEADDDQLGVISFYGDDDGDNATKYAQIKVLAEDVTDTEEDGSITLSALVAGTLRDIMVIGDIAANSAGVTLPNNSTYGTMKAHSYVTYSDESLKTNIQPVENALDKVKNLQGVTYDWKSDGSSDIGFIAQEVEKVIPQIVKSSGTEGSYAMNYSRVTALLVEGIKEQQAQIENLKNALASIKK